MWPELLRLGLIALAGIGVGLVILLQEPHGNNALRDRDRREPDSTRRPNRRRQRRNSRQNYENNLRESLEEKLRNDTADCLICLALLERHTKVWQCPSCWNLFHLACIREWRYNDGVTCPVCRKDIRNVPMLYKCMCGRVSDPPLLPGVTPHTCGHMCQKCCGSICHPGPCSSSGSY